MPLDIAILRFFNLTLANPAFDIFFKTIDDFNIWRWPVLMIMILLFWKGNARGRWLLALALITALVVDPTIHLIIKPLVARPRPCHEPALSWLRLIDGCGGKYGFPSSHAANFFGQAVVIGAFYKFTKYYLFPIAALVSIGRVYLGLHYASDIAGGAIYGAAIGLLVIYAAKRIAPNVIGRYFRAQENRSKLIRGK